MMGFGTLVLISGVLAWFVAILHDSRLRREKTQSWHDQLPEAIVEPALRVRYETAMQRYESRNLVQLRQAEGAFLQLAEALAPRSEVLAQRMRHMAARCRMKLDQPQAALLLLESLAPSRPVQQDRALVLDRLGRYEEAYALLKACGGEGEAYERALRRASQRAQWAREQR